MKKDLIQFTLFTITLGIIFIGMAVIFTNMDEANGLTQQQARVLEAV